MSLSQSTSHSVPHYSQTPPSHCRTAAITFWSHPLSHDKTIWRKPLPGPKGTEDSSFARPPTVCRPFPNHKVQKMAPSQDQSTIEDVWDTVSLKTFPKSFHTTGNMPGAYTICLDPSIPQSNTPEEMKKHSHQVQKTHQEDPTGDGWPADYNPSHQDNRIVFILNLYLKAW